MALQAILDAHGDSSTFVDDARISRAPQITLRAMRHRLLTLDKDDHVDLAQTERGLKAKVAPSGRLALRLYRAFPTKPALPQNRPGRCQTGQERALVVSKSDYPAPIPMLAAVASDAREMAELLSRDQGQFPYQNVRSFADGETPVRRVFGPCHLAGVERSDISIFYIK
jgi:hypothetical protein